MNDLPPWVRPNRNFGERCIHNELSRSCSYCDYDWEIAALRARNALLSDALRDATQCLRETAAIAPTYYYVEVLEACKEPT